MSSSITHWQQTRHPTWTPNNENQSIPGTSTNLFLTPSSQSVNNEQYRKQQQWQRKQQQQQEQQQSFCGTVHYDHHDSGEVDVIAVLHEPRVMSKDAAVITGKNNETRTTRLSYFYDDIYNYYGSSNLCSFDNWNHEDEEGTNESKTENVGYFKKYNEDLYTYHCDDALSIYDLEENTDEIEVLCVRSSSDISVESINSTSDTYFRPGNSRYSSQSTNGSQTNYITQQERKNSQPPISVIILYNGTEEEKKAMFSLTSSSMHRQSQQSHQSKQRQHQLHQRQCQTCKIVRSSDESISSCNSAETVSLSSASHDICTPSSVVPSTSSTKSVPLLESSSREVRNENINKNNDQDNKENKKWKFTMRYSTGRKISNNIDTSATQT